MLKRTFSSVAFALLLLPAAHAQDALLAPLPVRDQFLLGNGFFFFEPSGARVLDDGDTAVEVHSVTANTFSKSGWINRNLAGDDPGREPGDRTVRDPRYNSQFDAFLIDGEIQRTTLSIRRGLGSQFEVGIAIPVTNVGGGWGDGTIEAVHKLLAIGNDQREFIRRNQETVYLRSGRTSYLRERTTSASLGDVALSAKYQIDRISDEHYTWALEGAAELPTGNARSLSGSGSLDGGMQLIMTRQFPRTQVHAAFGVLRLGGNEPLGTRAQYLLTDTLALSRLVTRATSAVAQVTVSESPFRRLGIPEFERRSIQLAVGAQHQLGRGLVLHAAFIENLLNYENSADAGFQWGVGGRF